MKPKLPPSRLLVTAIAMSLCGIWFDRNVIHPRMRNFAGLRSPSLMGDVDPNPSSLSDGNDNDAPTIATNDATAPITTSRNAVATTSNSCGDVLDALDTKFNERRAARQNHPDYNQFGGGKKMFDLYEPEATCLTEERFGSKSGTRYSAYGDGPKFICGVDLIATEAKKSDGKGCLVYSIGSNNDIAFEKAVFTTMPGCEIHTFDPTLEDVGFLGDEYSTFHPWGLGTDGGKEGSTMHSRKKVAKNLCFQSVLRELGHSNRTIDVLKIDCQGCEYSSMPPLFDLIASGEAKVDQLLIEMNNPKFKETPKILNKFFKATDKAKLRIFHKERNSWGCDGYRCVEYAFVSEDLLRVANSAAACPTE